MKKIYFFFLFLIVLQVNAQINKWEQFSYDDINSPFKSNFSSSKLPVDNNGNSWKVNRNDIWKIKGLDTTKYSNTPYLIDPYFATSKLSIYEDKVAFGYSSFWHDNIFFIYTNYLGFFNGQEMKFFSEAEMTPSPSSSGISEVKQTKKYIWILKPDKLIYFDKENTFKTYPAADSPFPNNFSNPSIFQTDEENLVLISNKALYTYEDSKDTWEKILPDNLIKNFGYSDSTKSLYMVGNNKIYIHQNKLLQTLDVPVNDLGNFSDFKEINKDQCIIGFQYGFVLISHGQIFLERFTSYTSSSPMYFHINPYVKSSYLDNGILMFGFSNKSEGIHFSFHNNELKFEGKKQPLYYSFLYKTLKGASYYAYVPTPQGNNPAINLSIIENNLDTTTLTLPEEIKDVYSIAIDSDYVWIYNAGEPSSPNKVWRINRNQYFVKGNLFYDYNKNGIKDGDEVGINNFPLIIKPLGLRLYPDKAGNFAFAGLPGATYTLEIPAANLFNYTSKVLPYTFSETEKNAIGVTLANPKPEVRTNFYIPWPRCGATSGVKLQIENIGFEPIEKVKLILISDPLAEITSSESIEEKTDTIIFEANNLTSQISKNFSYDLTFPDAEKVGEVLNFKLITQLYANDEIVSTSIDSLSTIVRCSFDPNDKSVTPIGNGEQQLTLKYSTLDYLIRFENTGNDTAYTVVIHDTLDNNIDFSTLKVLGSSHSVNTSVSKDGRVIFTFENIMLPDSTTNKEKAQGFVRFSVKPKTNIIEGTVIKNRAGIVFDQNPPVITNEVFNTIVTQFPVVSSINSSKDNTCWVYPNPANQLVNIKKSENTIVEVYDFTGKKILKTESSTINISNWDNGFYIFRLFDVNGNAISNEKILVSK